MQRLLTLAVFTLQLILSLTGCSSPGQASFKDSQKLAGFNKQIDTQLLVIFEISHLKKANLDGRAKPTDQGLAYARSISNVAGNAVVSKLKSNLANYGVQVATEVIDSSANSNSFITAIARNRNKRQILTIQANSFKTQSISGGPSLWLGDTTWRLRLFDMDLAVNPEGKAVWSATTGNVQFAAFQCNKNNEQYQVCADRFASAIQNQLQNDGLLPKK